jgi:putative transposase
MQFFTDHSPEKFGAVSSSETSRERLSMNDPGGTGLCKPLEWVKRGKDPCFPPPFDKLRVTKRVMVSLSNHDGKDRMLKQRALALFLFWLMMDRAHIIHIVGVPGAEDALASVFRTVHMQYSQYYNRKTNTVGHLWQGRYYSCALDELHVHAAVRYVEMNPVRAGIVASAEDYPWSSAKSYVTGIADSVLSGRCFLVETIRDWKQYLAEAPNQAARTKLIKSTKTGRPCGEDDFVTRLEALLGRRFVTLPPGSPYTRKNKETACLCQKEAAKE